MKLRTFLLLLMVFAMNILSAQERTITGVVVDGSMGDDPLPGATVSIMTRQESDPWNSDRL